MPSPSLSRGVALQRPSIESGTPSPSLSIEQEGAPQGSGPVSVPVSTVPVSATPVSAVPVSALPVSALPVSPVSAVSAAPVSPVSLVSSPPVSALVSLPVSLPVSEPVSIAPVSSLVSATVSSTALSATSTSVPVPPATNATRAGGEQHSEHGSQGNDAARAIRHPGTIPRNVTARGGVSSRLENPLS